MIIFLDSSAWIKYFFNEEGTLKFQRFIDEYSDLNNRFAACVTTYAEMIAIVTQAFHEQRMNQQNFKATIKAFKEQWEHVDVPEVNGNLIVSSGQLAETYRLNGQDAFKLACALDTKATLFISCHNQLNDAAKHNGLEIWNPKEEEFFLESTRLFD